MKNFKEYCLLTENNKTLDYITEELVKVPHLSNLSKDQLKRVFKEHELMQKVMASKFIDNKDNTYIFKVVSTNDSNTLFATYELIMTINIKQEDVSVDIKTNPLGVYKKSAEARNAIVLNKDK